jgi:CRP-like cAMP-binding protein
LLIDKQYTAPPRRIFYSAGEVCEDVFILCEGWAVRLNRLADGRRQILSFLIAGDLFSATAPFQDSFNFHVQAVTQVRYGLIKRAVIKAKLDDASALRTLASIYVTERNEADQLLTDLGQRTAVARISRLILYLMERLNARGMVRDQTFSFPLRQQHIADAVGLTTVHVNRVVSTFRKSGLIEIESGQIKILNLKELQHIGEMR